MYLQFTSHGVQNNVGLQNPPECSGSRWGHQSCLMSNA